MDANGSRLQLLLGEADWGACLLETSGAAPRLLADAWAEAAAGGHIPELTWNRERADISLRADLFRFSTAPEPITPSLAGRRGAGVDRFGNRYWIDDSQQMVVVKSSSTGTVTPFWSTADGVQQESAPPAGDFVPVAKSAPAPALLRGLAVTVEHYLVVGVLQPAGLLIFDLHAGGPPRQVLWPAPFAPFDMAPAPDGGLWILDRNSVDTGGDPPRLWVLDRSLNVIGHGQDSITLRAAEQADFQPVGGGPPPALPALTFPAGIHLGAGGALPVLDPVAIDTFGDRSLFILDNADPGADVPFARVWRYALGEPVSAPATTRGLLDLVADEVGERFSLQGYDAAILPPSPGSTAEALGQLLIVAQDGNQAYAFQVWLEAGQLRLQPSPAFLPMRLFGGKGLAVSGGTTYYDSRGNWVPLIEQRRPRSAPEALLATPGPAGSVTASVRPPFDGHQPDCIWHRLLLDGCLPAGASVTVWSRAANTPEELAAAAWQPEPAPYRRGDGSELPFLSVATGGDEETWELLLQQARGRFLQLRLHLRSNDATTPRLRALRIYYPRFSYLDHYLPAAYREDAQSASFLARFLANLEGFNTALEDKIAAVQVLFDGRSVPGDYLDWLAGWFGVVLDPGWEEQRRRLFIAHAAELFAARGTLPGLIRFVRLATDPCPDEGIFAGSAAATSPAAVRIVEHFRTRRAPGLIFGDPSDAQGPGLTTEVSSWTPAQGAEPLHARYRGFLQRQYGSIDELNAAWHTDYVDFTGIVLSPTEPSGAAATDWQQFLRSALGFTYVPPVASDIGLFRRFLARRYQRVDALNAAYRLGPSLAYQGFDDPQLQFPASLPAGGAPLVDWIQFVSIVLPTNRNAHQLSVLVPTSPGHEESDRGTLVAQVRRIVELQKPAHTTFDVKEYWAVFRVGEARLGLDSLLDRGSRLTAVVLGANYLSAGYLRFSHPWSAEDRMVLGRDRVGAGMPL